ncbi:hypothetical protein OPV22_005406 [Ensete ventricosum]|uniref:Protein SCAI n=1 Tax=Ensete ventricosum TaxID=4639 RepID=A0AAV8RCR5_ENSVE|nr:hypothetical protein OPV22_005406 [Ensete ventricosum]
MGRDDDKGAASEVLAVFRALVDGADRKFAHVRDLPPGARGPLHLLYFRKAFKAYTRLWQFQQRRRSELVAGGLCRWEIGEVASRIGQLFYGQYQRTSEVRFLLEVYVFYEAIMSRGYFQAAWGSVAPDLKLRYKELRFHVRFLIVALLLNRADEAVKLADRFRALVDESKAAFPATHFREWKQMVQEISRFLKADAYFKIARPLRYNVIFDAHPSSFPYISRFYTSRVLRLKDALLTSYHRNEIKLAEVTLDTFRMLQCLEWEPSGSLYQVPTKQPSENGAPNDQNEVSGLIDINLAADMTDPDLPPNPCKAIIYHPSVSKLIAATATICEELPSDGILLIYISASGKTDCSIDFQEGVHGNSLNFLKAKHAPPASQRRENLPSQPAVDNNPNLSSKLGHYLCLGSQGNGASNNLYPEDLVPFTRKPLFLVIDSDSSRAFKTIHGAERGEASALLLSHEKPLFLSDTNITSGGSQFTYFLTAPLQAFYQLIGHSSDIEPDVYRNAESLLSSALVEWEVLLCTSNSLDQVWAQILTDPFLRRLILRFIFCRAVLHLLRSSGDGTTDLPECLPSLPESVSPNSAVTQNHIHQLAERLGVLNHFHFLDSIKESVQSR